MANALWVCSDAVITPLLRTFLGTGGVTRAMVRGRGDGGTGWQVTAFCGVLLGVYELGIVTTHFPDSEMVRMMHVRAISLTVSQR